MVDTEGPRALTLAALAQRFGVAQPSLYKHVGGLDDLHGRLAVARHPRPRRRHAAGGERPLGRRGDGCRSDGVPRLRPRAPRQLRLPVARPPRRPAHAEAAGEVIGVLADVLAGYGIEGEDAVVDAIRFLRSALHGFVALEIAGGFAMARPVDATFEVIVRALDRARGLGSGVVVEARPGRGRVALAGEHVTLLDLVRLEGVVGVHRDLALDQLGAAGTADPALAGERRIRAHRAVRPRAPAASARQPERRPASVEGDRDLGAPLAASRRAHGGRGGAVSTWNSSEWIGSWTPPRDERLRRSVDHLVRPAEEPLVDGVGRHQDSGSCSAGRRRAGRRTARPPAARGTARGSGGSGRDSGP